MVIFKPELARKILRGEKNVTRRRITHRDGRPLRYEVGKIYAIQPGRGKPHVGHLRVTGAFRSRLMHVHDEDVWREGFNTFAEFHDYWCSLNRYWDSSEEIAVLEFVRAPDCAACLRLEDVP